MKYIGIALQPNFDIAIDVKRDANGMIEQGMYLANTTYQNQAIILQAQKGEIREYLDLGVAMTDELNNDEDTSEIARIIRDEFQKDDIKTDSVTYNESTGKMQIKAAY